VNNILPVHSIAESGKFLKLLVYGESGVGKTHLVGTAAEVPELGNVLIADIEGGLATLANAAYKEEIDVVSIQNWDDMINTCRYLVTNPDVYGTLVIDSLSELWNLCMQQVAGDHFDLPKLQDWGKVKNTFIRFIRKLVQLPMNIVCTCLEKTEQDPVRGFTKATLEMQGASQRLTPVHFDTVVRLRVAWPDGRDKDPQRVLVTAPNGMDLIKDRWGLPRLIVEPTMAKIYWKIGTEKVETLEESNE